MKNFIGNVLFLDRSDINTDEIIPAKYLTENDKTALKPHLLEDLKLPGFDSAKDLDDKQIIITKANFGCGSSREHAPWALEVNGIHVVIAKSFARIFRQNMFNCGMLAIALSDADIEMIDSEFAHTSTNVSIDVENGIIHLSSEEKEYNIEFSISDFDKALIKIGGWVEYADLHY
ncbi:MAG: 3-isopropylmalate dehydratase small subunit [Desulfobacteraceae bacterium]|nr:3-isopropylmalate dehydratase small subunit [Desulfobacteraceae bacterium]